MSKKYLFRIIIVVSIVLLAIYFLIVKPKSVLKIGDIEIYREEIQEIKSESSKEEKLAFIVENKIWDHLITVFNIDTSFEAIESYIKKYHPELLGEEVYDSRTNYYQSMVKALEDKFIRNISDDVTYEKYLSKLISKDQWRMFLKRSGNLDTIKIFKKESNKKFIDYKNEVIESWKLEYPKEVSLLKICGTKEVKDKIDLFIERINKKRHKKIDFRDLMTERVKKYRCKKESQKWVAVYFEKNHVLYDKDYASFKKYLSFYMK